MQNKQNSLKQVGQIWMSRLMAVFEATQIICKSLINCNVVNSISLLPAVFITVSVDISM